MTDFDFAHFVVAPVEVFQDSKLTDIERRVLLAIFSFRDRRTGLIFPYRESIAKRAGFKTVETVSKATSRLVKKGWLIKHGKGGRSAPVRYEPVVPERLFLSTETVADPATLSGENGVQSGHPLGAETVADPATRKEHTVKSLTNRITGGQAAIENLDKTSPGRVVEVYHEILPALPRVRKLTAKRKRIVLARITEDLPSERDWRQYFSLVSSSPWLMGKVPARPGTGYSRPFMARFDFLIDPDRMAEVMEMKFHDGPGGPGPGPRPASHRLADTLVEKYARPGESFEDARDRLERERGMRS